MASETYDEWLRRTRPQFGGEGSTAEKSTHNWLMAQYQAEVGGRDNSRDSLMEGAVVGAGSAIILGASGMVGGIQALFMGLATGGGWALYRRKQWVAEMKKSQEPEDHWSPPDPKHACTQGNPIGICRDDGKGFFDGGWKVSTGTLGPIDVKGNLEKMYKDIEEQKASGAWNQGPRPDRAKCMSDLVAKYNSFSAAGKDPAWQDCKNMP